ncbi:MAG: TonB-dependent receptor domain-containing protein [bacterium]
MNKLYYTPLIIFVMNYLVFAQHRQLSGQGRIMGTVVEAMTEQPIELVNVILYDKNHNQITGTATNEMGKFYIAGIDTGDYIIEFSFVGFDTKQDNINISSATPTINLGIIKLEQKPILMEGVEVTAEKPPIEFKIDKKVINVKEHYTSQSGTAVDVLQNIPSISVDVEGNVSLRGSTNFRVLIDNRPSILEPSDALQQIPASTIDRIEIITNPSARYDPEGLTGIVNVITKKNIQSGINGIANLNLGFEQRYSGDFLINYRYKKLRTFLGIDYSNFNNPGTHQGIMQTWTADTVFCSATEGDNAWLRQFYGIKAGVELLATTRSKFGMNLEARERGMEHRENVGYTKWSVPGDTSLYFSYTQLKRGGFFYSLNSDYLYNFNKGHKLSILLTLNYNDVDEQPTYEMRNIDSIITSGWKSEKSSPMKRLIFNLDYTRPTNMLGVKNGKLEAGAQSIIHYSDGYQDISIYDTITQQYEFKEEYHHLADFIHNIYSAYTTYSGESGNFGYQFGLREEYTYRFIDVSDTNINTNIRRFDIYPTLHISYKFPPADQIMLSYTRRVNRPRNFDLEPFEIWHDPYHIGRGNPDLLPEFVDAYELGYQRQWGSNLLAIDGYYRCTHNKIEYITSVYSSEIMLSTVENIGNDYAYGIEPTFELAQFRWLNLNISANLYEHHIVGVIDGKDISQKNRTWGLRSINTLSIGRGTRLQITGLYQGNEVMAQGERKPFFMVNTGLRQELIPKVLNLTLQIRDLLSTASFDNTAIGTNFYIHNEFKRKSPIIMFGMSYNFNNYRAEQKRIPVEENNFEDIEEY